MNETNDKFEKRFSDRLADHGVDAPADMWDRIAVSMAEIDAAAKPTTPPITIAPHRRQRLGLRRAWQYGIAAMLLLGIGLLANRLVRLIPQPDSSKLLAEASVLYDPATSEVEPIIDEAQEIEIAPRRTAMAVVNRIDSTPSIESIEEVESTNSNVSIESATTTPSTEGTATNNSRKSTPKKSNEPSPQEQFQKRLQEVLAEERQRSGGRITTSLYASNMSQLSNQKASPARLAEAGMTKTEVLNNSHGEILEVLSSSTPTFRHQPETKLNHRTPVTVGVGVQYELTNRWALETGVTYTYLHSTGKSEGVFTYTTTQQLHYVGVPLSASYKFIDANSFEMYARAGGAVERAVSAKRIQTVGTADKSVGISTTQQIDRQGVQLSTSVAVGAELKLNKHIGLYAEAGAGYFFNNNQPLSYRTEHPLSLTLQAGARFHFGKNE
ncbi:MAG: outer membrane beta-barrel protein [Rikenellaceae bacterium]|nr:outer membrane beta-barrel protein [Rikenellaceae bacterium]